MAARPDPAKPLDAELDVGAEPCDVCGGPTTERNCKIICRRCGYTRDCGDP